MSLVCSSMRARQLVATGQALVGLWLLLGQSAFAQEQPVDPAEQRTALEKSGATIRRVNIVVDNVFDLSNPAENKRLYRWANRVHVRTRPGVIQSVLLFRAGDVFDGRLLDESARALRSRGFLADATIEPSGYDPATNTVEVDVHVRDAWNLAPDLRFSRSGGENEFGVGLADGNLLGTGKSLTLSYKSDVDRDEAFIGYGDPNVFNSRVRLSAILSNASDGHRRTLSVERPFFALDTRWSLGGSISDEERVDSMYDLGEVIDEFRHHSRTFSLQGGISPGAVGRTAHRWLFGVAADEEKFSPTSAMAQPMLLPSDRKLVYPWFGWQHLEDDYREMTELNDMGRTEDISLGLNLLFSVGYSDTAFGADRDALIFRSSAQKGWEPGGSGRLLLFSAGASTRREDAGLRNTTVFTDARYYRRNLEKHLFSVHLSALSTHELDAESQVLLGGDSGLRGYPLRYQAGERRAVLTVEQRFFTDFYPWRLIRMGYAVFADAGRVEGRDPRAQPPLGTLYDVGAGLRLTSPRSSGRSVVHIDLAFPLNRDASIDRVQLIVETKGSF